MQQIVLSSGEQVGKGRPGVCSKLRKYWWLVWALSFAGSRAFFFCTAKTIVSHGRWDVAESFARISLRTMSEWNAHYLVCSPLFSNKRALHSSELALSITFLTSQLNVPSISFVPCLTISSSDLPNFLITERGLCYLKIFKRTEGYPGGNHAQGHRAV